MKIIIKSIIAIPIVLMFSMCNNGNQTKNAVEHTHSSVKNAQNNDACVNVAPSDSAKYISKLLEIKGEVESPLSLTIDSLKTMNVATIENFNVVCQSGATMKEDKTCKGVLLKDILEKAKLKQLNHKDRNFYIVARATDNFKATFSWGEIFNNPTGDNVYVLFEENGQPIKKQGDMILICKNDIKTGPRHVYWLKSIEVEKVQ
jgi:DMSO/TMAO reductase YedYZ molybdopterin-dependent catalytic subunit